ncbi:hypothetical protein [Shewanella salipaludis]|uniref:Uncharacterized protein n=1 Tax=Shewanella salipaludis TaxID=2723052 RepID=A0A972FRA8_9GAMM|nr:hypothetical protein [Shewanella salipaludis]NMH63829.1 hypothetical protein [Shewanella salipaludis]
MRTLYRERRELTARVFNQVSGAKISIEAQPGGMHMLVKLIDPSIVDAELANKMVQACLPRGYLSGHQDPFTRA